jgi:hypothetical protein
MEGVEVTLTLRRRTTFYTVCLVLPMVLTSYMNSLVFLLPLGAGEKVSFLVTLSVSTSVFSGCVDDMMMMMMMIMMMMMVMTDDDDDFDDKSKKGSNSHNTQDEDKTNVGRTT